jgi:hypothetical protein
VHWNGSTWTIKTTPNSTGNSTAFSAVSCVTPSACAAVGTYHDEYPILFRPFAEGWNGTNWSIQSTADPPGTHSAVGLGGVSCTSTNACTAVGYHGEGNYPYVFGTLAERWNGTSWTIQPTPDQPGAPDSYLSDVSCPSATSCFAVGRYDDAGGVSRTLAERWNGTTWTVQPTPSLANSSLRSVSCSSDTACTAVGYYKDAGAVTRTLAERWNGTSWTIQPSADSSNGQDSYLFGVSCTSATACMAVGRQTSPDP